MEAAEKREARESLQELLSPIGLQEWEQKQEGLTDKLQGTLAGEHRNRDLGKLLDSQLRKCSYSCQGSG